MSTYYHKVPWHLSKGRMRKSKDTNQWNKIDKSDAKRRNTLGCLDEYTRKGLRLRNSQNREAV